MNYLHGQILVTFARILFRHSEAISGAYKLRNNMQGVKKEDVGNYPADQIKEDSVGYYWRSLTDEEKLKDTFQIMQRHIDFMQQCIEMLPTMKSD